MRLSISPRQLPVVVAGIGVCAGLGYVLRRKHIKASQWERTNFHGATVSLRGGVAMAGASVASAAVASALSDQPRAALGGVVASLGGGLAGYIDDVDQGAHDGGKVAKGLKGHLGALAHGQVTTGVIKIAGIGASALAASALVGSKATSVGGKVADLVLNTVLIAGTANLANLLDLRPGRALKATVLVATPLSYFSAAAAKAPAWEASVTSATASASGAASATPAAPASASGASAQRLLASGLNAAAITALVEDLQETTMLGDTGANAAGALLGTSLAANDSWKLRLGAALGVVALILASEKVSFSKVIAANPALNWLDQLWRRPL
ncbi:hypothetical protein HMPREF0045_00008 [Actinomyces graevenitzii C83]|uniref:Uncharacterized protein n=1 Tax=Actinomyces graevenitzii C83 TaxID=435830 RepID=G9PDC5_9ACTO|nr:hypothetical protein [Actinomyces graevenitzii]EHM89343.1 hypothetical protein HMPREF0045_00008 [Actinomyces graevenitzii C83]